MSADPVVPERRWGRRALVLFALWLGLLSLGLGLEHTAFGEWVFASDARAGVYLALQIALLVAGLVASAMTLFRGPNRDRALVLVPTTILVLYGLILISGGR
jgi:hypothetical protein